MPKDPNQLYDEFFALVERGDEAAAKKFLVDNLKEFPQETQDTIIIAFLEEAMTKQASDDVAMAGFKKRGVEMIRQLEEEKETLGKKLKMAEIKESL